MAHAGVRGLPANYGGSEEAIQALAPLMAERGVDTLVYCRPSHYAQYLPTWCGARLVYLPAPRSKNLETIVHSLLVTLHAGFVARPAMLHFHGRGNAVFLPLCRLLGLHAVVWCDGFEWERAKWGWLARFFHKQIADRIAMLYPRSVVADAPNVTAWYREHYRRPVAEVRYGAADVTPGRDPRVLQSFGLTPGEYCVFVGRLTPEKEVHTLIEAYRDVRTDWPLVIVGGNPYDQEYTDRLRSAADVRVKFLGSQFGAPYRALLADAAVSIHPSRVEGTSPALLSALASGKPTLVSDIVENQQAAGDAALYFSVGDRASLAAGLQRLVDYPDERARRGALSRQWAQERYSWAAVATQLLEVYGDVNPRRFRTREKR